MSTKSLSPKNENSRYGIFLDLDGSLLADDAVSIPEKNIKILKKLDSLNHVVCIISGRPLRAIIPIFRKIGINSIIVGAYNGAAIYKFDSNTGNFKIIYETVISTDVVKKIIYSPFIRKNANCVMVETRDFPFFISEKVYSSEIYRECHVNLATRVVVNNNNQFNEEHNYGVFVEAKNDIEISLYENQFEKFHKIVEYRVWPKPGVKGVIFDLFPRDLNKASACQYIVNKFDLKKENTMAFGDGSNDFEIIRFVNHGIKMLNGNKILNTVANDITKKTNNNAGIGEYLQNFFNLK